IALCLTVGCSKEVQSLPTNVIVSETKTTESTKTSVTEKESTTKENITTTESVLKDSVEPPDNLILNTRENIEVYEKITVADFVTDTNVEITNGDEFIDTNEIGEFEVYINCMYEKGEFQQKVSYTVSDTTAPVLLNMGVSPYVKQGEPFDLSKIVGYADNYDSSPVLSYDGTVDTETIGNYSITASVTDNSGNQTSWDMNVVVLSEIPTPAPSDNNDNDGTQFTDFINTYSGDNRKFGIDVSAWQGDIDFNAVKNAGCEFVIIRMGYFYDEINIDDWYTENIQKARDAGLEVGVYFYTTLNSAESVKELAEYIAEQLDGQELDFPVAFDWEEFTTFQEYGMSIHFLNELFNLFAIEMENYGYSAMLYSSKNFLNNFWINEYKHPVWLAHFVDETDYDGDYFMWQASSTGRIDGIDGYVDMNILYTDK
ncbi:MAG: DUF5011 domain-containing protein, partial [Ruminococcus sp.]|nr:DUF5011 domain-containing protein [Ruminococcus sp.]